MTRTLLLTLSWLAAALVLWVLLLLLELHWNLYDWQPDFDGKSAGLFICLCADAVAIWFLTTVCCGRAVRMISLVLCCGLLALGLYVFAREPLTKGLFERQASSPLWYRGGRLALLAWPSMAWVSGYFGRRK